MKINLYGITKCNRVVLAKKWLDNYGINYNFIDLKSFKIDDIKLDCWLKVVDLENLINKNSKTWRGLNNKEKLSLQEPEGSKEIIRRFPLIIKRPITEFDKGVVVGFSEEIYHKHFKK